MHCTQGQLPGSPPALGRRQVHTAHKDNIIFRTNLNFSFLIISKQVLEAAKFQSTQSYLVKFPAYTCLFGVGLARLQGPLSFHYTQGGKPLLTVPSRIKSKTYVTINSCGSGQRRLKEHFFILDLFLEFFNRFQVDLEKLCCSCRCCFFDRIYHSLQKDQIILVHFQAKLLHFSDVGAQLL